MPDDDQYYIVPTAWHPDPRINWRICDTGRIGGGEVAHCDKFLDAQHIKNLLNQNPRLK